MARLPPARLARLLDVLRAGLSRLHRRITLPEAAMLELITAGWLSQAIQAAAKLGIADVIGREPRSAGAIAEAIGADEEAVRRLLRALAQHGVFALCRDGRFAHSALSKTLRTNGRGGSVRGFAQYVGSPEHRAHWSHLDQAIVTGSARIESLRGEPFFAFVTQNPAFGGLFNEAMTSVSDLAKTAILASYDFGRFARIVDVGGGHGMLLGSILARTATSTGILFDLPEVTEGATRALAALGVHARCEIASGSFLDAVPRGGDAYLLKHILHDWDDARAHRILANVRAVIPEHGTLLLIEGVVPEGPAPHLTKLLDLEMLVSLGGKERTEAEFRALLVAAGFSLRRIVQTAGPICVIEATPHPRELAGPAGTGTHTNEAFLDGN